MAHRQLTADTKGAFPKAGATFPEVARQMLLECGLFSEQVQMLEKVALPGIRWRIHRSPPMAAVRGKLQDLKKHLDKLEVLYVRLSTPASAEAAEAAEAASRLYVAEESLEMPPDTLSDSLQKATEIVRRALKDLPKEERRHRRGSGGFIDLIMKALHLGHTEHFKCTGYGEGPSVEPMPEFKIKVGRKREPFVSIMQIVSEATGSWSVDEEIRDHIEGRPKRTARVGTRAKRNLT